MCNNFQKNGTTPVDIVQEGMIFEIQEKMIPNHVWFGKVIRNVGGRLLLRYVEAEDTSLDMWLFYLHYRYIFFLHVFKFFLKFGVFSNS